MRERGQNTVYVWGTGCLGGWVSLSRSRGSEGATWGT